MRTLLASRGALCFCEDELKEVVEEGGSWLKEDGRKKEEATGSWIGSR